MKPSSKLAVTLAALAALVLLRPGFIPTLPSAATVPLATLTATIRNPQSAIRNPKISLHTRLTDEPDPAKITEEFRMLREMGASWATEFFPWAYIQRSDANRYDWTHS